MFIYNHPSIMCAYNFDYYFNHKHLDFCFTLNNRNTKIKWHNTIQFYRIMVKD